MAAIKNRNTSDGGVKEENNRKETYASISFLAFKFLLALKRFCALIYESGRLAKVGKTIKVLSAPSSWV